MSDYNGKLVVFDLDDTLYKERDFVASAYNTIASLLAEKYNLNVVEMIEIMTNAPINPFDSLAEYLKQYSDNSGVAIAEDIPWMIDTYRFHKPTLMLDEEICTTLTQLVADGFRFGVITDGRTVSQMNKFYALGLDAYFDSSLVLISEAIGADKSQPDAFRRMMKQNPDISQFYYVGDNPAKDFLWPNRLGWTTVQLNDVGRNVHPQSIELPTDDCRPQFSINNLSDLLGILMH